jgi:hypothetical protein
VVLRKSIKLKLALPDNQVGMVRTWVVRRRPSRAMDLAYRGPHAKGGGGDVVVHDKSEMKCA